MKLLSRIGSDANGETFRTNRLTHQIGPRVPDMKEFEPASLTLLIRRIAEATQLDPTWSVEAHLASIPDLAAAMTGPDTPILTAHNAELLRAIEHIASEMRGLHPEQHDLPLIDADPFKRKHNQTLL